RDDSDGAGYLIERGSPPIEDLTEAAADSVWVSVRVFEPEAHAIGQKNSRGHPATFGGISEREAGIPLRRAQVMIAGGSGWPFERILAFCQFNHGLPRQAPAEARR
ncbi:MAG: hypothetical protein ACPGAP_08570, partial [Akkermansiaceae bacterium]